MPTPFLSVQNLSINFTTHGEVHHALHNISFDVYPGEIVALVGESGSGKSITSLSILQLLPSPPASIANGTILFHDRHGSPINLLAASSEQLRNIRGNRISMIFQEPMTSLNPVFTCGQQITEALRIHKRISKKEARDQALQWFERVQLPNPEQLLNRYPHQLSGGQRQRVMIAMAMCCKPALLICDEPTTALDVTVQKNVLELIKDLQQQTGMGVIFITHDLGVVAQIADRVMVMYKGQIVEQGSVNTIFNSPAKPYTRALIACRPVNHQHGQRLPVVEDFLNSKNQPAPPALFVPPPVIHSKAMIRVEHLTVRFPKKKNWLGKTISWMNAVNDVSFDIFENETLGIVGESGCGKTTLGRALLQLLPVTNGNVLYKEHNLADYSPNQLRQLRQHMQIVFQDPYSSLNPRKKTGAAIEEPLAVHGIINSVSGRKNRAITLLQKVGLQPEHYHRYPHELSGGQRQRVVIARALALQPSFIICDESVSALDVSVQAQVLNLLNDLKREFKFTILFISHDLSVVRYFSDRIIVMNKGKIEETGSAEDIYAHPKTACTKRLIAAIPKQILIKK